MHTQYAKMLASVIHMVETKPAARQPGRKTVRVSIKPSLYEWALQRSRLEPDDLASKFPKLQEWMAGTSEPTYKQAERFALVTGTILGQLFLPEPPDEAIPIADFRTVGDDTVSRPSGDLLDTIYLCQQRQDWYRDYARKERIEGHEWIGSLDPSTSPEEGAQKITRALSFDVEHRGSNLTEAFTKFRECAEEAGVMVMVSGIVASKTRRKLDPNEFRGFALADDIAPLVFVNGSDTRAAQIFTLAHEIAHIGLGQSALDDVDLGKQYTNDTERWCNQLAAEMLVPMKRLRAEFNPAAELTAELGHLARQFKSSRLVVLRRIYDADFLEWDEYRQTYQAEHKQAMEHLGGAGGNFYNTQPTRVSKTFAQAVIASTLEGNTSYTDAFQMLGFNKSSTFYALADRLGVT